MGRLGSILGVGCGDLWEGSWRVQPFADAMLWATAREMKPRTEPVIVSRSKPVRVGKWAIMTSLLGALSHSPTDGGTAAA